MDKFAHVNGITIHYLEHAGGEPTLVMLPGLTANAHSFDGLVSAELSPRYRLLALDLRGRGLSDKPENAYTFADHAADVLGLIDTQRIAQATLVGHSFGGLLAMYMAAHFPQRIERVVLIDAAQSATDPIVAEMIRPSLARLGVTLPSVDAYLGAMRQMPFLDGYWDDAVETYFRADMHVNPDGTARPHSTPQAIGAVIDAVLAEDWDEIIGRIHCPMLLINATGPYGPPGAPPILAAAQARETVDRVAGARYVHVPGNHVTMVFGDNAFHVVQAIADFVGENR